MFNVRFASLRSSRKLGSLAALLILALAPPAVAQRGGNEDSVAGRFDYYTLVLSWSPTYCASAEARDNEQCNPRDGRRYAFVLHGLWPQNERGWPQDCPTRERPFVPRATIDGMLDIMPSPKLVIHEYRKHGTCSGLAPGAYFSLARRFYEKIAVPNRYVRPDEPQTVSPDELAREFMAANPKLKPDMLAISCGGSGNRLKEVHICFDRSGDLRACGANESRRRLCSASRMAVPPWRRGAGSAGDGGERPSPLPGPR